MQSHRAGAGSKGKAMPKASAFTVIRDYQLSDRQWVTHTNVHHYTAVEGFDASFGEAVAKALDALEAQMEDRRSRFLIVEDCNARQPVGCAFFAPDTPSVGRLRLVYLDPSYRGKGIARAMIESLIAHAAAHKFRSICVSTYDRHAAACRLYRALGFQQQKNEASFAFGQRMRQIDFVKSLSRQK
jgi:GNAT superfamily N-acetyltransferase